MGAGGQAAAGGQGSTGGQAAATCPSEATDPAAVVGRFLAAFAAGDANAAAALLDEDIVYTNVGLNTLRGRRNTRRVIELLARPGLGFDVRTLTVATDGATVLNERVDEVRMGPLRIRFWVFGKFVVTDGAITLWRDHFDFLDCFKGFWRAVLGAVVPALNRPMPA